MKHWHRKYVIILLWQGFGFEILGKKPAQEISLNLSVKNAGFGKKIDRKNKGNENSDCRR